MEDVYFIDDKTVVIQDASGDKITLDTGDHEVHNMYKGQFREIYLAPYWYAQPTPDTLFIYDRKGNHYLFNLGQEVAYLGQSGDNLMMVTPGFMKDGTECAASTATYCNTFWQFDSASFKKVKDALHDRYNSGYKDENLQFLQ